MVLRVRVSGVDGIMEVVREERHYWAHEENWERQGI